MRRPATLSAVALPGIVLWEADPAGTVEAPILDHARALERFLVSVERRAFRIARIAVRHDEDALDIVQDAMLQLARRYARRPSEEWRPLFYRILQNRIRDCQRRRKARAGVLAWLPGRGGEDDDARALHETAPDPGPLPAELLAADQAMKVLESALAALPMRQQQAFMLRVFEGLDVAETAVAMGCTEGSVKTHYFRAVHTLRERLSNVW